MTLIKFLNHQKKEGNNKGNNINEETKIYEVLDELKEQISPIFLKIFENNDGLTVEKTIDIFLYYAKLIYGDIKNEIKKYQEDLDKKSKEIINEYFQKEHLINKKDFACAIRLFMTFILFLEEDKENKIKMNHNNVINYLKSSDLWKNNIYDNENFDENLNELKLINAQISQIIYLYEFLGRDIEDNFCDDVKEQIEYEKSKNNVRDEYNKNEDISNNFSNIKDKDNDGNIDNLDDDDNENENDDYDPFAKEENDDDDDGDDRD